MTALLLLALAAAETLPARIPNPDFDQDMRGWSGFGHGGFSAYVVHDYGSPRSYWLKAGWAARSASPPDAEYRVATRIDARRYRGRRIRVSAATRAPEFAHRVSSLFARAGAAQAETRIDSSETWRRHSVDLAVPSDAGTIEIGFRVEGTSGELNADRIRLEIVR